VRLLIILLASIFASHAHAGLVPGNDAAPHSYFDEGKKPITEAEFEARVKQGAHFSMTKMMKDGVVAKVEMEISPKNAAPETKPKFKATPGAAFPAFKLAQVGGGTLDNKALLGRYTVISFYFAECAPCVAEVPELNQLAADRTDLNFIGMSFDSPDVTAKFAVDYKFTWKLLPEASKLLDSAGVKTFPSFALLDPKGVLVAIAQAGEITKSDKTLAAWVQRLAKPRRL
jgi:peroxiredoxin